MSLIAFLAWVGLGADGLSSSAYGPEEAFRALGEHTYLAVALARRDGADRAHHLARLQPHHRAVPARAAAATSSRRSCSAPRVGVVSGCALLVDYVLTITISIAARRRRASSASSRRLARRGSCRSRSRRSLVLDRAQPARRQGVGPRSLVADLPRLPRHARGAHRRRVSARTSRRSRRVVADDHGRVSRTGSRRSGFGGMAAALPARLLARAAAPTPASRRSRTACQIMREPRVRDRQAHDALHGGLAGAHRGRHPARLPAAATSQPAPGKTMNAVLAERVVGAGPRRSAARHGFVLVTLVSEGRCSSSRRRRASSTARA